MRTWLEYRGHYTVSGDKVYVERVEIDAPLYEFPLFERMEGERETWLVYGASIRAFLFDDWNRWGHHWIYPFIKPGEIWIESNTYMEERGAIYMEAAISRFLMSTYDLTFDEAQVIADTYSTDYFQDAISKGVITLKSFYPKKRAQTIEYHPPIGKKRGKEAPNIELQWFQQAKLSLDTKRSDLEGEGWNQIFDRLDEVEEDLKDLPN